MPARALFWQLRLCWPYLVILCVCRPTELRFYSDRMIPGGWLLGLILLKACFARAELVPERQI